MSSRARPLISSPNQFRAGFLQKPSMSFEDGACTVEDVDPNWFFPAPGDSISANRAKQICRACPIRNECLEYHLDIPRLDGIVGGLSPRERVRLRVLRAQLGRTS